MEQGVSAHWQGRERAQPVRVIEPGGGSHVVSAEAFKNREAPDLPTPAEAAAEAADLTPDVVTIEQLEEQTMRTLFRNMRYAEKLSERTAAAAQAIRFMAIKYKLGPDFGADLDNAPTE